MGIPKAVRDGEAQIQTDLVAEFQGATRVPVSNLHEGVEILCRGNALFQQTHRLQPKGQGHARGGVTDAIPHDRGL
jgi:hypothetical protein